LSSVAAAYVAATGGLPDISKPATVTSEDPEIEKGVKFSSGTMVVGAPQPSSAPPPAAQGPSATSPIPSAPSAPMPNPTGRGATSTTPSQPPLGVPSQVFATQAADVQKFKTQVAELRFFLLGIGKTSQDQLSRIEKLEHDANMKALTGDVDWTYRITKLEEENMALQASEGAFLWVRSNSVVKGT
jgi:hypothetical protein